MANNNPFLRIVLGDLNFKSGHRCKHDKTSYTGDKIDALTSLFGL